MKRFFCFGCAVVLALSFSLVTFAADTTSTIQMDFPFFRYARLRQGGDVIYQGSDGERPITGVSAVTTATSESLTNIVVDLVLNKTYNLGLVNNDYYEITYKMPLATKISADDHSYTGSGTLTLDDDRNYIHYNTGTERYDYFYFNNSRNPISFSLTGNGYYYVDEYRDISYTTTISNGERLVLRNNQVASGDYMIEGFFDFPAGTFTDNDISVISEAQFDVTIGSPGVDISLAVPAQITDVGYSLSTVRGSDRQRVAYTVSFSVPSTVSSASNVQLFWRRSPVASILNFGVGTFGVEYKDTVTGIAGLSAELANWFGGLKSGISSGFSKIAGLITKQDSEAEEAVSDSSANSEAAVVSEKVSNIETFENDMINGAASQLENVDFTVPTSFGAASAFVGYIVTGVFNRLGGYQAVISVPLTFGLLLLLLGRGERALGMNVNMRGRGDRSSDSGGEG